MRFPYLGFTLVMACLTCARAGTPAPSNLPATTAEAVACVIQLAEVAGYRTTDERYSSGQPTVVAWKRSPDGEHGFRVFVGRSEFYFSSVPAGTALNLTDHVTAERIKRACASETRDSA
ncbi:MAG: hypothetical protein OER90_15095 [Gemmatimonadota bacterium]|nr:hypothetical protein [Gemmatimonadota bacterium]